MRLEKEFWAFVDERERIRARRAISQPWPWTSDPVLRDHHFTNVRRSDDPGTRRMVTLLRALSDAGSPREDLLLTTYCYRLLNRPATTERHGLPHPSKEGLDGWFRDLDAAREAGESLGSQWHQTFYDRFKKHAYSFLYDVELSDQVWQAEDGQEAVRILVDHGYGLGPFFGIQVVADLAEAQVGTAFGRDTMMPVSAGSRIGLQILDGVMDPELLDNATYERSAAGRRTRDLRIRGPEQQRIRELVAARPDLRLTPVDVEHVLCEWSKYWLIKTDSPAGRRRAMRLRRTWG